MPLLTEITRDGEKLKLRWGWWHVNCMSDAAEAEGVRLADVGEYVLTQEHTFTDESDGEVLVLKPGDKLSMWREWGKRT